MLVWTASLRCVRVGLHGWAKQSNKAVVLTRDTRPHLRKHGRLRLSRAKGLFYFAKAVHIPTFYCHGLTPPEGRMQFISAARVCSRPTATPRYPRAPHRGRAANLLSRRLFARRACAAAALQHSPRWPSPGGEEHSSALSGLQSS